MINPALEKKFFNKTILVTGGAGFIGSNLAKYLSQFECRLIIIDNLNPKCGGTLDNLQDINKDRYIFHKCNLITCKHLERYIAETDYIFNLAGIVDHIESINNPSLDLKMNVLPHIHLLEICRYTNPNIKIVFTSTRGVYGKNKNKPLENTASSPIDINGIHKSTAEQYHLLYTKLYSIQTCCLRLTNTYGPRHQAKHPGHGIINWWIKQIFSKKTITVYKPGTQIRDINYVDDVVKALILSMVYPTTDGKIYNLGGSTISLLELARLIKKISGHGIIDLKIFPKNSEKIDVGNYIANYNAIQKDTKWSPQTSLEDGIRTTIDYYVSSR